MKKIITLLVMLSLFGCGNESKTYPVTIVQPPKKTGNQPTPVEEVIDLLVGFNIATHLTTTNRRQTFGFLDQDDNPSELSSVRTLRIENRSDQPITINLKSLSFEIDDSSFRVERLPLWQQFANTTIQTPERDNSCKTLDEGEINEAEGIDEDIVTLQSMGEEGDYCHFDIKISVIGDGVLSEQLQSDLGAEIFSREFSINTEDYGKLKVRTNDQRTHYVNMNERLVPQHNFLDQLSATAINVGYHIEGDKVYLLPKERVEENGEVIFYDLIADVVDFGFMTMTAQLNNVDEEINQTLLLCDANRAGDCPMEITNGPIDLFGDNVYRVYTVIDLAEIDPSQINQVKVFITSESNQGAPLEVPTFPMVLNEI